MANVNPPKRGQALTMYITLRDANVARRAKVNPTIASGDFTISKDDGSEGSLTNTPTLSPASSRWVKIALTATEMDADHVKIACVDATDPPEWCDRDIWIPTTP